MNKINMKLNNIPFNQIKNGSKTVEVRLNDEKRKQLRIGDIILFTNNTTNETLEKTIVNLKVFDSFKELYNSYDSILLGARGYTEEQYCDCMNLIYSKEKEQLNKVLAIELDELDSDLREKMTSRELVFNGKLLKVKKDTIVLPNNKEAYREWIEHNGACAIVYVDEDDNILLEKQFRYPFGRTLIELPAGKLDSVLEDHKECAIREFREETGLISKDMTYLGETGLAIAYSNEVIYIYYTNKVEQGETEFDSDEFLSSFKIPFDKALEMCNNGEIIDSKTIIGINLYNNLIRNKNK